MRDYGQGTGSGEPWMSRGLSAQRQCIQRQCARGLWVQRVQRLAAASAMAAVHGLAWAQQSPFLEGATSLQANLLAWLTPIAIILVMVLGAMAMANRMSWGWCLGAILGIAIAFGAPQIVTWVRGMFGV